MAAPAPTTLTHARYAPGEVLGAGGQGVVLRVTDREAPERPLVAKVWRSLSSDDGLAAEFALLSRVDAPGLVRAHDLGRDEATGLPFLVEDFVEGLDAVAWIASAPASERVHRFGALLADVTTTLTALHDAGFLHGDLKPAHVRVSRDGRARLLDLGAAVVRGLLHQPPAMISPGFAAPEVVAGAPPTERSELYGLGALAWAAATGQPPSRAQRGLRAQAPWVPPSLADVVDALLAEHPRDRPEDARAVLALLGRETSLRGAGSGALVGREVELRSLAAGGAAVQYLVGPSGIGKSHVARELVTRTLLAGRPARLLAFPDVPGRLASRLVAYLRGADEAWPFGDPSDAASPALIVLDDLERAPPELAVALDTFRCMHIGPARARFLATAREAPAGAEAVLLGPLDDASLGTLARALGEHDPARASEVVRAASGSPGWVAAAVRGIPLTEAALRAGVAGLPPAARAVVGLLGVVGGAARPSWVARVVPGWAGGVAQAAARGLVVRRAGDGDGGPTLALTAPALAPVLAALADAALVDALAEILQGDPDAPVVALRTLATATMATSQRDELLTLAASRARRQGRRGDELDALLALAASPGGRTAELLGRLERLTRDSGQASSYPQVLGWLDEAGDGDARLRPLALRRRAEKSAREGDHARAEELAEQARAASHAAGDPAGEAFALATLGLARLFRSEWASAHDALRAAREELASVVSVDDVEEVARLDHNLGVVAVYRGRIPEAVAAFERSLGVKQRLGDRAGMRACLRNLGYALVRAGRLDEAATALDHALALAVSLGQAAGRAWCLAARAEVELARGAPAHAERLVAEALALGEAVPAAVRADLALLSADVALAWGDGAGALAHVASLSAATRAEDPFVEARALIASSRAQLAALPARPREAARLAIRAIRVARAAGLPEPEAGGLAALRAARGLRVAGASAGAHHAGGMARDASDGGDVSDTSSALWAWLQDLGAGAPAEGAAVALAGLVAREAGAERAFVALVRAGAAPEVWAADLDGLAIAEAGKRLPEGALEAALASERAAYQRDVPTAGGHGSRLAVAAPAGVEPVRAVVVAEHRFVVARFDSVSDVAARRWATAAALLARVGAPPAVAATPAPEPPATRAAAPSSSIDPTTFVPLEGPRRAFPTLIGKSAALRRALARLDAAIDTELPVLLVGETGVGKELFARAVHDHGARARAPFVAVNCAAIPDSLFEAELFGHARGSFTGADRARPGLFASADAGTLFLDEIGELSLGRQASLLRVLETQRYRPVGSDEEKPARARIVAATNRDLELAVAEGRFRQDLLFRLDVLRVRIPPLRLREGDVEVLARHFLKQAGSSSELSPQVLAALSAHAWPGNVRELSHQMQRLAALRLPHIELAHLPRELRVAAPSPSPATPTVDEERATVERALAVSGGNISRAAKTLGLSRHGLKKRMLRLGLREAASKVTDS